MQMRGSQAASAGEASNIAAVVWHRGVSSSSSTRPVGLRLGLGLGLRGWPRLIEAGGRPELDLALAGRIKAGERMARRLWAAVCHMEGSWHPAQAQGGLQPRPASANR